MNVYVEAFALLKASDYNMLGFEISSFFLPACRIREKVENIWKMF